MQIRFIFLFVCWFIYETDVCCCLLLFLLIFFFFFRVCTFLLLLLFLLFVAVSLWYFLYFLAMYERRILCVFVSEWWVQIVWILFFTYTFLMYTSISSHTMKCDGFRFWFTNFKWQQYVTTTLFAPFTKTKIELNEPILHIYTYNESLYFANRQFIIVSLHIELFATVGRPGFQAWSQWIFYNVLKKGASFTNIFPNFSFKKKLNRKKKSGKFKQRFNIFHN